MKYYNLTLRVAELPITFHFLSASHAKYVKSKFPSYVYNNHNKNNTAEIYWTTKLKEAKKGTSFYYKAINPKEDFEKFNNIFRQVFTNTINRNSGFVLHASSLVKKNKAYVFTGKKTAGKSTIRKLFSKLTCLGDDSAIVRNLNGKYYLFGSPFYQRTNMAYPNKKIQIDTISIIQKDKYDMAKSLTYSEQILYLSANVIASQIGDPQDEKKEIVKNVVDISIKVKVLELHFKKSQNFFKILESNLIKQLSSPLPLHKLQRGLIPYLPKNMQWRRGLVLSDFFREVNVINQASWLFEFNGRRNAKKIADLLKAKKINSAHLERVRSLSKIKTFKNSVPIFILKKENKYTVIDGNHRAVMYANYKQTNATTVPVVIGNLDHKKCLLF